MEKNKKITIKDIAKEAGVSICTVSHVINKTHYVSPQLTERVNKAIEKYNYRMDFSASSLRKKVSRMIGVIIPNSSSQFFALLTKYIENFSRKIGYHVVICNSDYNVEIEVEHIEALMSRNIDGIIMIPVSEDIKCYRNIFELNTPFIFVERKLEGANCNSVVSYSYDSISQIIDYLVDLGHKKIAYIGREKEQLHQVIRFNGFTDAIKRHGLELKDEYIIYGDNYRFRDGYEDMLKLVELRDKPTAVLVFNDVLAIGAMQAVKDKGYKIPDDFSVVGFDNIEIGNYTEPPLTTITTMKEQISKVAFDLLISKINKKSVRKKDVFIKTEIVMRKSTGPVKK